jgi:glycosyltransferase involved in cell wall biosynthesis
VNAHNPPAHSIARACKLTSRPVLVMTRHGEADRTSARLVAAPITDGIIACSTRVRDAFRARHPRYPSRRLIVIENGVDTSSRAPVADALASVRKPGHRVVVTVARLDPVKDLGTMIRALATLGDRKVQLVLVGDGPTREELTALTRDLGLEERVTFLGFRRDVADILRAADVFALSSISEGMPLAALEAMAAGLPVVATAVGGTPEVVRDGVTGLLVPARDPNAFGAALARVLDDDALRASMGAASRARVEASFSLRVTTERYLDAYEALRRARLPAWLSRS